MNHLEFAKRLEDGSLPSVLFFEGTEERLKQEALSALRRKLLPEGLEDLNETRFTAPETQELIAAAETLPFMADRRLILVRDHPAVVGRGEADDALIAYLPKVPPTSVLLFYCVQPVKQKKIRSAVSALGGLVQFSPLTPRELADRVVSAFRDLGKTCDSRTADLLVFTCGTDLNQLMNEAAKIAAYHPDQPAVTPEDVQAMATPSSESTVFALVDDVMAGRDSEAFRRLSALLLGGERRTAVLSMLLRQFRLLQHVKILQYEKRSGPEMEKAMGVSSYRLREYTRLANQYTGTQVKNAVALCLRTDLAVKSGELREDAALDYVMLELLRYRREGKR